MPANFSGAPDAHVTVDGSCPTGSGGAADPVLWVGSNPLAFPHGWDGPDAHGIFSKAYGGSTSMALESSSNSSTDPSTLSRLVRGNCSGTGPTEPASWQPGTFCDAIPVEGTSGGGRGKLFFRVLELFFGGHGLFKILQFLFSRIGGFKLQEPTERFGGQE